MAIEKEDVIIRDHVLPQQKACMTQVIFVHKLEDCEERSDEGIH